MPTTELGACEWFVWDLRRSNLIDRGQLDQVVGEYLKKQPRAEPPALAQYLVDQRILSSFQAERILQGKTQGLVLGPYTLLEALGTGSMGVVYKAQSKTDNELYVVKVLPRRSMWNVRIARRLVRSFEQCRHPTIVPFVDVGTAGDTHYLAWKFVDGETLESLVQNDGKLAADQAALYALQTSEGLEVAHQQGLSHGMLKPSNIMIGADQKVHILDFGIGSLLANSEGQSLVDTMSTANALTSGLDCASPESILEPTNRTPAGDQYSLGCLLYYCLAGDFPFREGSAVQKMMAHQNMKPRAIREYNPDVPDALVAVIDRLMQKKPEDRFPGMAEVIEALRPLAPPPSMLQPRRLVRPKSSSTPPPQRLGGKSGRRPVPSISIPPPPKPVGGAAAFAPGLPTREPMPGNGSVTPFPPGGALPRLVPKPLAVKEPDKPRSLEDSIGPLGLFLAGILAAGLTWLLSQSLFR
jgi:serine/threonine-protein kinase